MSCPKAYVDLVHLIQSGDEVSAAVVNQLLRQITSNLQYFRDTLELAEDSSGVFARRVSLEPAAAPGAPVYYDRGTDRWKCARLSVTRRADGTLTLGAQAQVWGVVCHKSTATVGDILLFGTIELDVAQYLGEVPTPGAYFLGTDGVPTRVRQSVNLPVFSVGPEGKTPGTHCIFVNPIPASDPAEHEHYQVDLVMEPSGVGVETNGVWSISGADVDLEGWLPANHAVFAEHAPVGAKFGYNLSVAPFGHLWPPEPLTSLSALWQQPDSYLGSNPLGGLLIADQYGIWWMSDCEHEVPWEPPAPTTTSTTTTTTTGSPQ